MLFDDMVENIKAPVLLIIAWPPSFGDIVYQKTMALVEEIKSKRKTEIETIQVYGTHHFHMITPDETAEKVLDYLRRTLKVDDDNSAQSVSSKL